MLSYPFPTNAAAATISYQWTVTEAIECVAIAGATWNGVQCTSSVLVNSHRELLVDGIGNDNLLCEASERCLHPPNSGAYQRQGDLVFVGMAGDRQRRSAFTGVAKTVVRVQ